MRIAATKSLFAWDCLEDSPSLAVIRRFIESIPDTKLLESLRAHRGKGSNDYPVTVSWGVLILTILLRHPSIAACLAELKRNEALRKLIGIKSEEGVPNDYNISRFMAVLGKSPHREVLSDIFTQITRTIAQVVPDLGKDVAGDSTALSARPGKDADPDGLPGPSGGRKEYTDAAGNVTHIYSWFGYKLHLVADKKHELAVGYKVTDCNTHDSHMIPALVEQAQAILPEGRMETFAYDKAADDEKTHAYLEEMKIAPVIENRSLWKSETERMLPGSSGRSNIVYDEAGTVYCYDKVSEPPRRQKMAYIGHEKSRGTLKYRCPAAHMGIECPSASRCNQGKRYGMTVRVKRDIDLRRFPPIPRGTKQFERLYAGRTAVERVNARLKVFWGADDGNITGAARFHAYVGAVMVVHAGLGLLLASAARKEGPLGQMRLSPIAQALREKAAQAKAG